MKILILGAGNMGAWFVESLCLDHEVGVYDMDKRRLKYFFNAHRFIAIEEVQNFKPELVINAVSLQFTTSAFDEVLPYIDKNCILSDIASVKNGLKNYYKKVNMRFVSTHPMFGPTFANIKELSNESAVIIKESDEEGKKFFIDFYKSLDIKIYEYTFTLHDQTIAYSLSIPFTSTFVFAACMKKQEAPGTTFKKHLAIAKGLMSENDYLLSEIMLSPYALEQVEKINSKLGYLIELIKNHDEKEIHKFIGTLRKNIGS
jgi:prephenate dehydrogenase